MSGKRIWILNHYAISPDMAGGTRHYDLGRELAARDHEVTIFASGFDHNTKKHIKVSPRERFRVEEYMGVVFVWLNTLPYYKNDWRRIINMLSYGVRVISIAGKFKKPDVIIGSSMHPFAALAGWWLAKKYKARFIFEVRDLWPQTAVDMGAMKATSISAKILYAWEKFMYSRAEKIIVLLPYAGKYIEKLGVNPEKVVWIPNGVDLERFDNPEPLEPCSEVAKVFDEYASKFKVVYTGAHGPANGLEIVVETASKLKGCSNDIQFFLIGDGPEKKKLLQRSQYQALNNITFLNPVPKSKIPTILGWSDLLLHCLKAVDVFKHGISPNKLFDYLASGKPVIMSADATNNIVQDANAGIVVEPENAQALAEGIFKIQRMAPEERQRLGSNGREYVEMYHCSRVLGAKLAQIIEGGE